MTETVPAIRSISHAMQRLLAAHHLQKRYLINAQDIAPLLGLSTEVYQKRLKKAGLSLAAAGATVLDVDDILIKINAELQSFSQGEGLPDKAAVDGLTALAKAVKSITELSKETRSEPRDETGVIYSGNGGVKPEDVRAALNLINRRITERSTEPVS